jgi:hypothetical protein
VDRLEETVEDGRQLLIPQGELLPVRAHGVGRSVAEKVETLVRELGSLDVVLIVDSEM